MHSVNAAEENAAITVPAKTTRQLKAAAAHSDNAGPIAFVEIMTAPNKPIA